MIVVFYLLLIVSIAVTVIIAWFSNRRGSLLAMLGVSFFFWLCIFFTPKDLFLEELKFAGGCSIRIIYRDSPVLESGELVMFFSERDSIYFTESYILQSNYYTYAQLELEVRSLADDKLLIIESSRPTSWIVTPDGAHPVTNEGLEENLKGSILLFKY